MTSTITTAAGAAVPPASIPSQLKTQCQARQQLLVERNETMRDLLVNPYNVQDDDHHTTNFDKTELNTTIEKVDQQWNRLAELQQELELVNLHSQTDSLGVKKGRYVIRVLMALSFISFLGEAAVAAAPIFAPDTSWDTSIPPIAIGAVIVVIVGSLTGLAWYIHEQYQEEHRAIAQFSKADVEDTQALLKLLRHWKNLHASPNHTEEKEYFDQLNTTNPRVFDATADRERWVCKYIESLPNKDPLKQQLLQAQHLAPENADQYVHGQPIFDVENPRSEKDEEVNPAFKRTLQELSAAIEERVGGTPLRYFMLQDNLVRNPLLPSADD